MVKGEKKSKVTEEILTYIIIDFNAPIKATQNKVAKP